MVAISRLLDKLKLSETMFPRGQIPHFIFTLIVAQLVASLLSRLATPTSLSKPNLLTQGICLNRETGQGALVCLDVTLEDPE